MPTSPPCLLFISLLLLSSTPSYSFFFLFTKYQTVFSLSHSLITRVANRDVAPGDLEGAERARELARNLNRCMGLGFYRFAWSAGWDYVNYAWGDTVLVETLRGFVSDLSEAMGAFGELNQIHWVAAWIDRNYRRALSALNSVFARLLRVFTQPGPLREVLMTLQKDVVEGQGFDPNCQRCGSSILS